MTNRKRFVGNVVLIALLFALAVCFSVECRPEKPDSLRAGDANDTASLRVWGNLFIEQREDCVVIGTEWRF